MANLPQADNWAAGVYQIEVTDPVLGGVSGPANAGATNLADRTVYLRNKIAGLGATVSWVEVVVTASGSWTCPAGVTEIFIEEMVGGGGGGAGDYYETNSGTGGAGGGEGARVVGAVLSVVPTTVYTLTIGAAGAAGATSVDHGSFGSYGQDTALLGGDGGSTSFGALLTCPGGKGGGDISNTYGADYVAYPGVGGSVTFNGVVYKGAAGDPGDNHGNNLYARGGGRLGSQAMVRRTGVSTHSVTTTAAGYGCGGCGGIYGASAPQATAGGAGIIRFSYPLVTMTGKPTAI